MLCIIFKWVFHTHFHTRTFLQVSTYSAAGGNQWPEGTKQLVKIHIVKISSQEKSPVEDSAKHKAHTPRLIYRILGWMDNLNYS